MTQRVAYLVDNTLEHDRRALLELETLAGFGIELTVYCNAAEGKPAIDNVKGFTAHRVFTDEHWLWRNHRLLESFADTLLDKGYTVLHCHDHFMLHIGAYVKRRKPDIRLIYESRELFYSYPIHFFNESFVSNLKSKIVRAMWVRRERRNAKEIDYLITVNGSLANLLKKHFRLKTEPVVTRNIGHLRPVERNSVLRDKLGVGPDKKIIVYASAHVHPGNLVLEKLSAQIKNDNRFVLLLVAQDNLRRRYIKKEFEERGVRNVLFHDMLPVDHLEQNLAGCDIGLITAWDRKNLSYWLALDNKMFTYIMSGLPVLSPDQPEYRKIIDTHRVGVCVNPEKPNAYAQALEDILSHYNEYRTNSLNARMKLNWENEKENLLGLYRKLNVI